VRTTTRVDTRAVGRGALAGVAVIVPVTIAQEVILGVVDDPCTDPVVVPIFLLILGGFGLAGYRTARSTFGAPYPQGLLAGLATFAAWLPLKLGKTAVFGGSFISDDCGGDGGFLPALIGGITVALLAMGCGLVGSFFAVRRSRR
jgi:hypothetical protein